MSQDLQFIIIAVQDNWESRYNTSETSKNSHLGQVLPYTKNQVPFQGLYAVQDINTAQTATARVAALRLSSGP